MILPAGALPGAARRKRLGIPYYFTRVGGLCKEEKPKRKRHKHLSATPHQAPELISLYAMNRLKNSDVRKALKSFYVDEAASMGQAGHSSQVKENDAGNYATEQNKEGHPIV